MAVWNKTDPTPEQIARWGHIAAAVRKAMQARKMTMPEFNAAAGFKRGHTHIYNIVNCKSGATPMLREAIGRVLGIPEEHLLEKPSMSLVEAPEERQRRNGPIPMVPPARDVLNFAVEEDGQARLRLDLIAPIEVVTPVLRMLLDLGLVMGPKKQAGADELDFMAHARKDAA